MIDFNVVVKGIPARTSRNVVAARWNDTHYSGAGNDVVSVDASQALVFRGGRSVLDWGVRGNAKCCYEGRTLGRKDAPPRRWRISRMGIMVSIFLLAASLPFVARASELLACVRRTVHFDGSTALNYYRVTGQPDAKLFIFPQYSAACLAGKKDCEPRGAYLIAGNEVAVGKQCGRWSYIQYIGSGRITKGWVESARLQFLKSVRPATAYWQAKFNMRVPPSGRFPPPFRITKGQGVPVCEAYLQRLNTTDYQGGHAYPQAPFDGIPESDAIPGFALLHRVMLQSDRIIQMSEPLERWWEQINPHLTGYWGATPDIVRRGGIVAWRYEPSLDIDNNGKPVDFVVWRGYGLSGAAGRCGEPFNPNYTWSMRCQQLPLVMKDDLQINYTKTAELFERVGASGPDRDSAGEIVHPFVPVGFFITPFVYRGTTYFSTFFNEYGDYEGKRQGEWKLWNTLGVLVRHRNKEQEVCEYQLRGNDYPKAHTGLER